MKRWLWNSGCECLSLPTAAYQTGVGPFDFSRDNLNGGLVDGLGRLLRTLGSMRYPAVPAKKDHHNFTEPARTPSKRDSGRVGEPRRLEAGCQ